MPMYADPYLLVDTDALICAHHAEGHGEHDGLYAIALVLRVGDTPKRVFADYPDKDTRDAAFVALGRRAVPAVPALADRNDGALDT